MEASGAGIGVETDAEKIARLEGELAARPEPGSAAAAGGAPSEGVSGIAATPGLGAGDGAHVAPFAGLGPLDALAKAGEINPEGSIADHLKAIADEGIRAVISPGFENAVLGALAAVVHDLVKKVV